MPARTLWEALRPADRTYMADHWQDREGVNAYLVRRGYTLHTAASAPVDWQLGNVYTAAAVLCMAFPTCAALETAFRSVPRRQFEDCFDPAHPPTDDQWRKQALKAMDLIPPYTWGFDPLPEGGMQLGQLFTFCLWVHFLLVVVLVLQEASAADLKALRTHPGVWSDDMTRCQLRWHKKDLKDVITEFKKRYCADLTPSEVAALDDLAEMRNRLAHCFFPFKRPCGRAAERDVHPAATTRGGLGKNSGPDSYPVCCLPSILESPHRALLPLGRGPGHHSGRWQGVAGALPGTVCAPARTASRQFP